MELYLILFGFIVASYSIIANDAIQTLGTFISSNGKNPWYILWAFASSILVAVLFYGWWAYQGDVSYGRLDSIPVAHSIQWWHVAPPIILLFLTRWGIPVSTTFLVLSVFTPSLVLGKIIMKSLIGYGVAFVCAILLWAVISKTLEKSFIDSKKIRRRWIVGQWLTTGFLWSQWLIQDLANIFVFLPRQLSFEALALSTLGLVTLLAFIFRARGGHIQSIIDNKANTHDIRSATIIDALYAVVLLFFKELNNLPMSTTWVFLGVLAGREYALNHHLQLISLKSIFKDTAMDLSKATLGLVISILVALTIKQIAFDATVTPPEAKKIQVEKTKAMHITSPLPSRHARNH